MCTSIYQKRLSSLTMACMDESWVCLLLLLYCTAVTVSQDNCTHGSISLVGIETSITAAGYLKICINDTLWAVYDESWGEEEAAIVCRSLGFSPKGAIACGNSCLGNSSITSGLTNFTNCTIQDELVDCGNTTTDFLPNNNAGVICSTIPQNCSDMVNNTIDSERNHIAILKDNIAKIAISLAGATVVLFFTLVGVVIGWVCSCHKNKLRKAKTAKKKKTKERVTIKFSEQNSYSNARHPGQSFSLSGGPLRNPDYDLTSQDDGPLKNPTYTPTSAPGLYFDDDLSYELTTGHAHFREEVADYEVIDESVIAYEMPIPSINNNNNNHILSEDC